MNTWFVTLSLGALAAVAVSSLHLAKAQPAPAAAAPTDACEASVRCLDDERCEITCTRADGQTCTIELSCDADGCRVIDCDGPAGCDPADCDPADCRTAEGGTQAGSSANAASIAEVTGACAPSACAPASCAPANGPAN